jgi:hypothetical protein
MYIYLNNVTKCGKCDSTDVARMLEPFTIPGRLVCLSCGHREPKPIPVDDFGNVYVYKEEETTF